MKGYVVAEVEIQNPEEFENYRAMVPATLAVYGGRFLVRGGAITSLEGDWNPPRIVVLEFDSLEQAVKWHGSEEYRAARTLRQRTAKSRLIAVEGV